MADQVELQDKEKLVSAPAGNACCGRCLHVAAKTAKLRCKALCPHACQQHCSCCFYYVLMLPEHAKPAGMKPGCQHADSLYSTAAWT